MQPADIGNFVLVFVGFTLYPLAHHCHALFGISVVIDSDPFVQAPPRTSEKRSLATGDGLSQVIPVSG